jgi:molybdate/tungstate transport system ATP-binding protein
MSAGIAVEGLTLTLGTFRLHKLDFALSRGEILVILGPNGSGKSVTLETIAGFHRPSSGRVLMHGRDVTLLPPERRNVGFVVQNYGLFPHLNVAQNVAIAQRRDRATARGAVPAPSPYPPPQKIVSAQGVDALLAYFGVTHLAQRMPQDLSPGEKQRVALARALAGAPDVFLFDEPFSALDSETRRQLREELLAFLRALSVPAIFLTHDHADAIALADTIVVLRNGAIMQRGSPAEVFQKPANSLVARFVGVENVLAGQLTEVSEGFATVAIGDRTLRAVAPALPHGTAAAVQVSIRAENVTLYSRADGRATPSEINRLDGRVAGLLTLGPLVTVNVDCGFHLKAYLLVPQVRQMNLDKGSSVVAEISPQAVHVMMD